MITKRELQMAHRQLSAEGSGEPPTAEEVLAYFEGRLSGDEEARVRALLVEWPEMVRAATEPFPSDDARPGDPDYLSPEELDRRWASQERDTVGFTGGRVLQFWRMSAALAATVALALGGLLWQAQSGARIPRVISNEQVLLPDGQRGSERETPASLTAEGESYLLVTPILHATDFNNYRLEIVALASSPPRPMWRSAPLSRPPNDTFAVVIPRTFFGAGRYQVVLYGLTGALEERLAGYTVSVPAQ